jgi:alpha-L-arabinofuranosidase
MAQYDCMWDLKTNKFYKNKTLEPKSCIIGLLMAFLVWSCQSENRVPLKSSSNQDADFTVVLEKTVERKISNYLMGFNIVYAQERDVIWADGILKKSLKEVNTSVLRYPGGTVTTFFHWKNPTGNGWIDKWDPNDTTPDKSGSEFMDVDQYMQLVRETGAVPMMGINMSSGWRWNRIEDGINEALALMKYCKDKNFPVTYWYLDNEPYQHDSNGGSKTPEQYGELINLFVPRMKEFDPNIKIVANWNSGFRNKRKEYDRLIATAGKNIDMYDAHYYWSWGNPTWEKWLEGPVKFWTGTTYIEEIAYFRQMMKESGYPDAEVGSFEWNVGPNKSGDLSAAQCAFIQTEMMMQFMEGGLDMAIMWPLHWPSQFKARSFFDAEARKLNPIHHIFRFLGNFQGGVLLDFKIDKPAEGIYMVSALSADQEKLFICLLNKSPEAKIVAIDSPILNHMKQMDTKVFTLDVGGKDYNLNTKVLAEQKKGNGVQLSSESVSITMMTFSKNDKSL